MEQNPLLVPELLNLCILYLRDSTPDLLHCALVARAWAYPAQAQIFREVTVRESSYDSGPSNNVRFQQLMHDSPHIIQHTRRLTLSVMDAKMLWALCNLPFTALDHFHGRLFGLAPAHGLALQQMLGRATLRSVHLTFHGRIAAGDVFWTIWSNCRSRMLTHLDLDFFAHGLPLPAPSTPKTTPVALNVLRIRGEGMLDLSFTRYAWSLTSLTALEIDGPIEAT
ncbi:hypothetical protein C8R46DRAFT_1357173 [Mycena filopes]|nr:hypothetical protein C8R46DRAFT_1357173 [Mycena filopes]